MSLHPENGRIGLKVLALLAVSPLGCSLFGGTEVANVSAKPEKEFSLEVPPAGKKPRTIWFAVSRADGDSDWSLQGWVVLKNGDRQLEVEIKDFNSQAIDHDSCQSLTDKGGSQCFTSTVNVLGIRTVKQSIKLLTIPDVAPGSKVLIKGKLTTNSGKWPVAQDLRLVIKE